MEARSCSACSAKPARVAQANGYPPRQAFLQRAQAMLTAAGSPLTASMLRDMERHAPIEADHIVGDMIARAKARRRRRPSVPSARGLRQPEGLRGAPGAHAGGPAGGLTDANHLRRGGSTCRRDRPRMQGPDRRRDISAPTDVREDCRGPDHHQSLRPLHPWRDEPARISRPPGRARGLDRGGRRAAAALAERLRAGRDRGAGRRQARRRARQPTIPPRAGSTATSCAPRPWASVRR